MTPHEEGVEIPYELLSPDTIHGLITEFVTRDGTDYGIREITTEAKVGNVKSQLRRGEARIVWDAVSETANIVRVR